MKPGDTRASAGVSEDHHVNRDLGPAEAPRRSVSAALGEIGASPEV